MVGDVLGPAVYHVALLCVSSHSWLQQRREVRMYLLAWHKHCSGQRDQRASLWGDVALAAAGGGADWAAHAPFGGGLRLRLRIWFWFWLRCVIVGGHGFGLSIPICADIIAPGLWLTLLLTLLQSETDEGTTQCYMCMVLYCTVCTTSSQTRLSLLYCTHLCPVQF